MNSKPPEIIIITERYFFLKTPLKRTETRLHRRRKFEKRARKAIIKLSEQNIPSSTNFLEEDQNKMTTWVRLAITECSKIKKHG